MSKVLFTLVKSPFEKDEIHTMNTIAQDNEKGVILFQDAVYYATTEDYRQALLSKGYSIYAVKDELEARGCVAFSAEGVELMDYDKAVELIMEQYDDVISL